LVCWFGIRVEARRENEKLGGLARCVPGVSCRNVTTSDRDVCGVGRLMNKGSNLKKTMMWVEARSRKVWSISLPDDGDRMCLKELTEPQGVRVTAGAYASTPCQNEKDGAYSPDS
jgi:hypothetical protein